MVNNKDTADAAMEAAWREVKDSLLALVHTGDWEQRRDIQDAFIAGYNAAMNREWTPCDDRLPERTGDYLVCLSSGYQCVEQFYKGEDDYEFWKDTPIAWQPLPKPYQPDSGEEKNDDETRARLCE